MQDKGNYLAFELFAERRRKNPRAVVNEQFGRCSHDLFCADNSLSWICALVRGDCRSARGWRRRLDRDTGESECIRTDDQSRLRSLKALLIPSFAWIGLRRLLADLSGIDDELERIGILILFHQL